MVLHRFREQPSQCLSFFVLALSKTEVLCSIAFASPWLCALGYVHHVVVLRLRHPHATPWVPSHGCHPIGCVAVGECCVSVS